MLPPLPRDVLSLCCEHLRPYDIIRLTVVSTDWVDVARGKALWTAKLSEVVAAAVHGLAQPRDIEVDTALLARTRDLAWACAVQRCQHLATVVHDRTIYFHVLPHVATAAVATLSERRPRLCFVSFAQRAYDTTDFVDDHPGGSYHMQRHHGADATPIFDAFPHSSYAHELMRDQMLRFDAIAAVGRCGAPAFAWHVVPRAWTPAREARAFVRELCYEVGCGVRVAVRELLQQLVPTRGKPELWALFAALGAWAVVRVHERWHVGEG